MIQTVEAPAYPQCDFAATMPDDSMKPDGIRKGDKVGLAFPDRVAFKNGKIAAVKVGERVYLSHVWIEAGAYVQLYPSNNAYMSSIFTGDEMDGVEIIGVAVEVWHILNPAESPESTLPKNDPQGVPV